MSFSLNLPNTRPYTKNQAKIIHECSTINNNYVPVMTFVTGTLLKHNNRKLFYWELYINPNIQYTTIRNPRKDFTNLVYRLQSDDSLIDCYLLDGKIYQVGTSHLSYYDKDNKLLIPLMVLCVPSNTLYSKGVKNLQLSDYILLINNSFSEDHKKVYRKVHTEYIKSYLEDKLNVLYTNDIMSLCYNIESVIDERFNTLTEMNQFLNNLNLLVYG